MCAVKIHNYNKWKIKSWLTPISKTQRALDTAWTYTWLSSQELGMWNLCERGSVSLDCTLILLTWSPVTWCVPRLRQIFPVVLIFYASFPGTHLTPTTCTPSFLALSRRCLQSLREQPKVITMSLSRQIASVATWSSSLSTEKQVCRSRGRQIKCNSDKNCSFSCHMSIRGSPSAHTWRWGGSGKSCTAPLRYHTPGDRHHS